VFATKPASTGSAPRYTVIAIVLLIALMGGVAALLAFAAEAGVGGTAPNPRDPRGQSQEESVRNAIEREGYEQPFGKTDAEIRANLGIEGKTADVVGYHPAHDRWLIVESKGGDVQTAYEQLRDTTQGLIGKAQVSPDKIELRMYLKGEQYAKFFRKPNDIAGWRLNDGYLGWQDDPTGQWVYAEINGLRINVLPAL
jgi:hypothetical protein